MGAKRHFETITVMMLVGLVMTGNLLHAQRQWNIAVQGGVGTIAKTFESYD